MATGRVRARDIAMSESYEEPISSPLTPAANRTPHTGGSEPLAGERVTFRLREEGARIARPIEARID